MLENMERRTRSRFWVRSTHALLRKGLWDASLIVQLGRRAMRL